jgi:hypothetical protein
MLHPRIHVIRERHPAVRDGDGLAGRRAVLEVERLEKPERFFRAQQLGGYHCPEYAEPQ